jgi:PAS domain S-box-containing protein
MVRAPMHSLLARAPSFLATAGLSAMAYFAAARLGYGLTIPHGVVALWPPAGVMLGLLLLSSRRFWPAILVGAAIGAIVAELLQGNTFLFGILAATTNLTESLIAASVVRYRIKSRQALATLRGLLEVSVTAAAVTNALTAWLGALLLQGYFHSGLMRVWLVWWAGDALGILIFTPVILAWLGPKPWRGRSASAVIEAVVVAVLFYFVADLSLGNSTIFGFKPLPYATLPILFWAAVRFGYAGAATLSLALTLIATWHATQGLGPFAAEGRGGLKVAIDLYLYLGIAGVATLIPAAALEERRLAGLKLRDSEDRYRGVVNAATDAIITIDEASRIEFVNPAIEAMLGYAPSDLIGHDLTMIMPAGFRQRHKVSLQRYVDTGQRHINWQSVLLTGLHRDGHEVPLEVSFGELHVGERRLFTGILRDITEKRRLEEQFRQAHKMEAIGQLAGGIAHDFNNMLTAIHGYSSVMLDNLPEHDTNRGDVAEILKASERAASLTRQLLAFSRQQVLAPRVMDLAATVHNIEPMLHRLIGEHIALVVNAPLGQFVRADPGQLEQVILNLAINARDAMPAGGRLEIAVSPAESPAAAGTSGVTLTVRDTGEGMDENTVRRIFEPFFTTKELGKGTGLGLSTVDGIVSQSGGEIRVTSAPGAGATFTITLPRAEQEADAPAAQKTATKPHKGKILLVEDDDTLRTLMKRFLERDGYIVCTAALPSEALVLAGDSSRQIDALVSDVYLPEMNGRSLADLIRASRPGLRVLLVSGYTNDDLVLSGKLGADTEFLQKPFEPRELIEKVDAMIARSDALG